MLSDHAFTPGVVSVVVVGDEQMRRLNAEYAGGDATTDVLAFELGDDDGDSPVGEIIVNADVAASTAQRYGNSPARELTLYVIHGALHLAGLDDLDERDRRRMRREERKYLALLEAPEPRSRGGRKPR